jgi:L-asparaginase/Glu-tRNA(Gln) amidotransferase subunit D
MSKILNYSRNEGIEGAVLVIGFGGAGIIRESQNPNENLKRSFDLVPYLKTCAGQIDFTCLFLKDSSDLTADDVALISETVRDHQNEYDGFVVIGGSDTMPYVASSTAFSLRGLNMPVMFIGARQNAKDWDSDFRLNLPNAIKVARMGARDINAPSVGEVGILFDDTVVRATASINKGLKLNNPIESPRIPRLADVGWTIKVESIARPRRPSQLNYTKNNNRAVYEKGKVVGVITNCKKGSSDMGLYDVSAIAIRAGAISLGPMVKPAAIEKNALGYKQRQGRR